MSALKTVGDVFKGKFFRIPDYQRGYSWEARHVEDLLSDLELLEEGKPHYAGTLVLHGEDEPTYNIVDGQQRMTTIVMLLNCIQRALPDDEGLSRDIRNKYVVEGEHAGLERCRLTLNSDNHDFFQTNIIAVQPGIGSPTTQSQQRLSDAHHRMGKYIEGWGTAALETFYKKVVTGLGFIVYEVGRESDVGVMFEVMNDRGKALSELEKVKNYLLYIASKMPEDDHIERQLTKKINGVWSKILTQLMSAEAGSSFSENRLLRTHWFMVYDSTPKNWKRLASIKEKFPVRVARETPMQVARGIVEYLDSLQKFCVAYCDIVSPMRDTAFAFFAKKPEERGLIQKAAHKLDRLGSLTSFIPLIAAVWIRNLGGADKLLPLLKTCELYAARVYNFAGRRSNAGQSYLFSLGNDVYHSRIGFEYLMNGIYGRLEYYAPERKFVEMLKEPARWYGWRGIKYLLYEYEEHLAKGKPVALSWSNCTKEDSVEHILPQSWQSVDYWKERWRPKDAEQYLHSLGNLTLTYNNAALSNKPFPDKREIYAESNLFSESEVARQYTKWTRTECKKRRAKIVGWMEQRWRIPEEYRNVQAADADMIAADENADKIDTASEEGEE